ncbi:hypothetical protein [Borrelia hermsii]|uniref:Uncharacterized protein n=2 Tax=Borrelia hermsii TaxID=140 RepID=A0AAN0X6M2_BORHE|nr:hypothetical protein [Borrelia hermsii]AMR76127.1 hypothetical protein A0V01_05910 [Borrelia hermsii]
MKVRANTQTFLTSLTDTNKKRSEKDNGKTFAQYISDAIDCKSSSFLKVLLTVCPTKTLIKGCLNILK